MDFYNLSLDSLALVWWIVALVVWIFAYLYYIESKSKKLVFVRNYKALFARNKIKFLFKMWFILASLLVVSIILLWPRWWSSSEKVNASWIDIMFALDVSNSMKALDFSQNWKVYSRLNASKYMISKYVWENPENRYGMVTFAWDAFTAIPLTNDAELFQTFLDWIYEGSVSAWWTDITKAIASSLNRFIDWKDRSKIIILISDWGDEEDVTDYNTIKRLISENNIQIFTIWVWSKSWSPIPESQDFFWRVSFKTFHGKQVLTSLYEYPLVKVARASNWEYFYAKDFDSIAKINESIKSLERKTIEKDIWKQKQDLYRLLAGISLGLFLIWI